MKIEIKNNWANKSARVKICYRYCYGYIFWKICLLFIYILGFFTYVLDLSAYFLQLLFYIFRSFAFILELVYFFQLLICAFQLFAFISLCLFSSYVDGFVDGIFRFLCWIYLTIACWSKLFEACIEGRLAYRCFI